MSFLPTADDVGDITNAYQHVLGLLLFLTCGEMISTFPLKLGVGMQLSLANEMWAEAMYIIFRQNHLKANVWVFMFFSHVVVFVGAYIELKMPSDHSTQ